MLLSISTTHRPATDLGYLIGKHPARLQSFELANGIAHVFYPQASEMRCTVALLLAVDPVGLVRKENKADFSLDQYVNDRPYTASSLLTNAISKCLGSAMNGNSKDRPELAQSAIPLEARIAVVRAKGGEALIRRLFEPLGYEVELKKHPLDEQFPAWGEGRYFTLDLRQTMRLSDLLSQLYLLLPVLDNEKHYFLTEQEGKKLLEKGGDWLPKHPERELITRRYLNNRASLTHPALEVLLAGDAEVEAATENAEIPAEAPKIRLHDLRLQQVFDAIRNSGAKTVLDLGCGEGRLLKLLAKEPQFTRIIGMDVTSRSLEMAARRLRNERATEEQRERLQLLHGSLLYRDRRLEGFDAAALVEVIEHLDSNRLAAFEQVVFGMICPKMLVLTTPNAEYNTVYQLETGKMRHSDHRFEWTRAEFAAWAKSIGEKFGYDYTLSEIGETQEEIGASSQMVVFQLKIKPQAQ
jgi:3' terminal RNA ribose 2'-O-methyltransferase Hen1